MKNARRWHYALSSLVIAFCFSLPIWADPPARVGRLNYLSGSVSFRPGSIDEWAPARLNFPLTTGDHLWADQNSRAEIHVGSTAIRLAPQTAFAFLNLDDRTVQIRLSQGSLNLRLRQLGESEVFEIDTPNVTVSLLRPGLYRVDVDEQGNTTVTAWQGESEVTAAGSAFTLHPRQTAFISGLDAPTYDLRNAASPDGWDDWCLARDRREEQAASLRYVSREMIGYEDLDEYGTWRMTAEYGPVWVPARVVAGWAPYHFGHWAWVEPWGWTWIDDAPWGFAPFHYGRWVYLSGAWAWVPGTVVVRPVYAPALVAFVGGSNWHVSLSLGGGGVAWFPLGPREVYVPAYRASSTYVRNVNVTNVRVTNINVTNYNLTNVNYVNRSVPGAVTAVPQEAFVKAQPVAKAAVAVPERVIAAAPVSGMTAAVAPRTESVLARPVAAARPVAQPPAAVVNRVVVARTTPPPAPVPFAARQQALAANPGRPLDPATLANLHHNVPAAPLPVKLATVPSHQTGAAPNLRPTQAGAPTARPVNGKVMNPPKPGAENTNSSTDRPARNPLSVEDEKAGRTVPAHPLAAKPAANAQIKPNPESKPETKMGRPVEPGPHPQVESKPKMAASPAAPEVKPGEHLKAAPAAKIKPAEPNRPSQSEAKEKSKAKPPEGSEKPKEDEKPKPREPLGNHLPSGAR